MQFKLQLSKENKYPKTGLFIKSPNLQVWLEQLAKCKLSLHNTQIFALPGPQANSIWGCLAIPHILPKNFDIMGNSWAVTLADKLIFPELCDVFPRLINNELHTICQDKTLVLHPEIGIYELENPIDFTNYIDFVETECALQIPENSVEIPLKLTSFLLVAQEPHDVIKEMLDAEVPEYKTLSTKPLNILEKAKLLFYKALLRPASFGSSSSKTKNFDKPFSLPGWLEKVLNAMFINGMHKMVLDFESLQERNRKEVDKLIDLIKKDPANGLQFAIPLDERNAMRGSTNNFSGLFSLSRLFPNFSLFNTGSNTISGNGRSIDLGNDYYKLRNEYEATAKRLIAQGEYKKAAFVYLKLLKNPTLAATTLEKGAEYKEAAAIYINHLKNKEKAAYCYEKAQLYSNAFDIYKEQGDNLKCGDMLVNMARNDEAMEYYHKYANAKIMENSYLEAGNIYKVKMDLIEKAQETYLQGWYNKKQSRECLNEYFGNIEKDEEFEKQAQFIYEKTDIKSQNPILIKCLIKQINYRKNVSKAREITFELIAKSIDKNVDYSDNLVALSPFNLDLKTDTIRYRTNLIHQRTKLRDT